MIKKSLFLLNKIKLSSSKINKILSFFPDPEVILSIKRNDLENLSFLSESERRRLVKLKESKEAEKEMELAYKEKIELLDIFSPEYPSLLKEIDSPPLVLYIKGDKEVLNKMCFSIVGTRLPSIYGVNMAQKLSFSLASLGFVIVSGLARGIDTQAHKLALKAGRTVAVLGSGLFNLYPKENKELAREIAENGAVISEFPLFEPPLKENFPRRNRIISGLSKGVLIVEAAQRSGALITARYALEQNREVFALPGEANSPLSKGPHSLIKQGAKLVDSIDDILQELNISFTRKKQDLNLTAQERIVFDMVSQKGVYLEELILKSNLKRNFVNKTILSLQIKGIIKELRPLYFVKANL